MEQQKIGRFIAQLRQEQGLTQAALGERLGVTNKTVSRWENGNYMPDVSLLPRLAKELGVGVNELLNGERIRQDSEYRKKADEAILAVMRSSFSLPHRRAFWRQKWLREHMLFLICGFLGCGSAMTLITLLGKPLISALFGVILFGIYAQLQVSAYLASKEDSFAQTAAEDSQEE